MSIPQRTVMLHLAGCASYLPGSPLAAAVAHIGRRNLPARRSVFATTRTVTCAFAEIRHDFELKSACCRRHAQAGAGKRQSADSVPESGLFRILRSKRPVGVP